MNIIVGMIRPLTNCARKLTSYSSSFCSSNSLLHVLTAAEDA